MSIRIMLADDHRMFREALRGSLCAEPDMEVVAEAGTGEQIFSGVATHLPDVLLLDIGLPDMNGIEIARRVVAQHPQVRVVALSGYADRIFVEEMLRAGARAYVLKSSGADELMTAIRAVAAGKMFLSSDVAVNMLGHAQPGQDAPAPPVTVLGKREQQVLRLLAHGKRSSEIAAELGITPATVDVHRRNLKQKLGLRTTAELTRYAIREGLHAI